MHSQAQIPGTASVYFIDVVKNVLGFGPPEADLEILLTEYEDEASNPVWSVSAYPSYR